MSVQVRPFRDSDTDDVLRMTVEAFDGVSISQNTEERFGPVAGVGWQDYKRDDIRHDVGVNAEGVFVAEVDGEVAGYATTRLYGDRLTGHIPNLAVDARFRGRGIGRKLVEAALDYFRGQGMRYARIETLEQNEIGMRFYPSAGFTEIARQIHYFREL